jgi:hypothetical protein
VWIRLVSLPNTTVAPDVARKGKDMWMKLCAVCKALLHKLRLCDSVRCHCGRIWWGYRSHKPTEGPHRDHKIKEIVMAKVIEFYVPKSFRKPLMKWAPQLQCGKVIEFCSQTKKSA